MSIETWIEGRKYDKLLSEKGFRGFPSFGVLDAEGNLIARHDGPRSVDGFKATAKKGRAFLALKAKAAGGDRAAQIEFAIRRTGLGHIDVDELEEILEPLGELTAEQRKAVKGFRANAKVAKILAPYRTVRPNQEETQQLIEAFVKLHRQGLVPSDGSGRTFWRLLTSHAHQQQDAELFEACIEEYWKPLLTGSDNEQAQAYLGRLQDTLEQMKAAAAEKEEGCGAEDDGGEDEDDDDCDD
ncbi:MAG: hypothetical protein ACE5JG_04830 [Planctomycetota bacterium]